MIRALACAFVLFVAACGASPEAADRSAPTRTALERVQELARTGDGHAWQASSPDVKHAFTLAAVVGLGLPDADRNRHAATLSACLDRLAAASPDQQLAQLAADCANTDLRQSL